MTTSPSKAAYVPAGNISPDFVADLTFAPVRNPAPRRLTAAQIDRFNVAGYIHPLDVFDATQARANREYFDFLLEAVRKANDGRDAYAINGYHSRCRGVYDLATNPAILDLVEDLLGPNFVAWGTHFFCKLPGDPKSVPWHQDASYWPLTPARTVTAWIAIDDADVQNACMHVIPGTHAMGHLEWKRVPGQVLWQQILNAEQYGQPAPIELKAGQISLHADMLAHGSGPNLSARRRCGLTIRYCPVSVRSDTQARWNDNSIWCRGSDPSGHWANIGRPDGEYVTGPKPRAIGGN